jgi:hypothetical protein
MDCVGKSHPSLEENPSLQPVAPRYTDFIYIQVCMRVYIYAHTHTHTPVFVAMATRRYVISELSLTITKLCVYVYVYVYADHGGAARSKAWTVFSRSKAVIVDSNPTQGMDVCVCVYAVFVSSCV